MITPGGRFAAPLCHVLLVVFLALPQWAAAAAYSGRSVQDVLEELGSAGVTFVYNTELVPPGLLVTAEPVADAPVAVAEEILAPHGLVLVSMGNNVYAVSRGRPGMPGKAGGAPVADAAGPAAPAKLDELVVTTSRYAMKDDALDSRTLLAQADLQVLPTLADEPLRAVRHLPGSAASGVTALTHVRGGAFDEVLLVLDGLPMNEPFHLKNFLAPVSVFDSSAIQSMDVSSGGFTANFGDRMSGVIDISSLEPPAPRYTELGMSVFHASGLSAGEFADDRGRWVASVRRSNLDLLTRIDDQKYGEPEYFDAFGRISYDLSDVTTLFAAALTSRDDIALNTSDQTEKVDADYRNTYVWGGWQQDWQYGLSSRLMLALTDLDNTREGSINDPGQRDGYVNERRTLRMGVARLDVEQRLQRFYNRIGIESRELKAKYRYDSSITYDQDFPVPGDPPQTTVRSLSPEPDGHQFSAYVTSRVRITDGLSAELGLRWDDQTYDDLNGSGQYSPRLNVLYELTPRTRLRAAWGRFWQAQGINELQVEDGVGTFYPAQRADHLIFSIEQDFQAGLGLRLELYQKDYDAVYPHFENLFDPVKLLPELEPDRVMVNPVSGRARGVEVMLTRRSDDPWSWWLGYAWSRVTDRIDGEDVVRSWDQRHAVNAGLRYSGELWEFTVTDNYHTGWPTTELLPVTNASGVAVDAVPGPRNAVRFNDYNSLDFRVMRRFQLPASTLEAFFEMTNALGWRNDCCTEYTVEQVGSGIGIDKDVDFWPRFIPNLGVLWKF